jgi:hypothetical protein
MSKIVRAGHNESPIPSLLKEYANAFESSNESHFDWMRGHGVADRTMYSGPAVFGIEWAQLDGSGLYKPHPDGMPVMLSPVGWMRDFEIYLTDLAAWRPTDPTTWWLRLGSGDILNPETVEHADHFKKPLIVHANPLVWLQHNCQGCVFLAWRSGLRLALGGIQQFGCTDEDTGRRLDELLRSDRSSSYEIRIVEFANAV